VEVVLTVSEFYFNHSRVTVPVGKVKFIIINVGNYSRGLAFGGGGISQRISRVNPTRSATLTVRFAEPGEVIFYPVPQNALYISAGMNVLKFPKGKP